VVDLNKCALEHDVYMYGPSGVSIPYFRCDWCGFLFTTFFDDWSPEEFSTFIYNESYVNVDGDYVRNRAIRLATHLIDVLSDRKEARILDYGAGRGVFANHMNSAGFQVENYDPFSFPARPEGRFDVITCFEVIEHSPAPQCTFHELRSFLRDDGCVLFTEALQPPEIRRMRCSWWYAAPRNGHVSMYTDYTLATLAELNGFVFYRGQSLHGLRPRTATSRGEPVERVGTPWLHPILGSPAEEPAAEWQAVEGPPAARFRWSASSHLEWRVTVPLGLRPYIQARIPFIMGVTDEFAKQCQLAIGGTSVATTIDGSALVGEGGPFAAGEIAIGLTTPQPISPAELRDTPDRRPLGLAIRVRPNHNSSPS
jgi:2-polyprenyl-6-hydroxyphenyl methylase/3-demethylubiquinone-9 3-methyltransferase